MSEQVRGGNGGTTIAAEEVPFRVDGGLEAGQPVDFRQATAPNYDQIVLTVKLHEDGIEQVRQLIREEIDRTPERWLKENQR